jgi:prepilin-type N-terminal cleavage/methylation domain-containing protein
MKLKTKRSKGGFTLIEIIIAVVVLAIVAAMMASYLGKSFPSLTRSSVPIASLNKSLSLNQVMEKISAYYAKYPHWRPNAPYAAGNATTGPFILPTTRIRNGYMYFTSGGGKSGATQPAWPLSGTVTETSGTPITWTISPTCAPPLLSSSCTTGCTPCPPGLSTLIGAEGSDVTDTVNFCPPTTPPTPPCSYHVINNHFIYFDSTNTEQVCNSLATCPNYYPRYLKVTIGFRSDDPARTGETLTTLFVLR